MKEKILAVTDKGLEAFLESLGLIDDLKSHILSCSICGVPLSLENIGCIYPIENEVKLCCENLKCLQKIMDEITPLRKIQTEGGNGDES